MVVNINNGSYFGLLKESILYLDWLPYFHESRFIKNLHNLTYSTVKAFEKVNAPALVTSTINLQNGQAAILIFPDESFFNYKYPIQICGQWDDYKYSDNNADVFFVSRILE